jgi:hypothetical protein
MSKVYKAVSLKNNFYFINVKQYMFSIENVKNIDKQI